MVVAVRELDLELDTREERRGRVEDELGTRPGSISSASARRARRASVDSRGHELAGGKQLDDDVRPRASRRRCRARGWRASSSRRESSRLDAVRASDLRLVGPHERPAAHDLLAADDQPVDAVRSREDEARDQIVRSAELETIGPPDGEICLLAGLERADVVAPQHGRAAARAEPKRLAGGHRLAAAPYPGRRAAPA